MVAKTRPMDWRYIRAVYAVSEFKRTGLPICYDDYYDEFDMNEDELDELFDRVAMNMNTRVKVLPKTPTVH
jgi:DNA-binding transcriptional MocR family regulator